MSSFYFFFSSRRRHTRWTGDWSSDVCSSDLNAQAVVRRGSGLRRQRSDGDVDVDPAQIGRASCRGKVENSGGGGLFKKKKKKYRENRKGEKCRAQTRLREVNGERSSKQHAPA